MVVFDNSYVYIAYTQDERFKLYSISDEFYVDHIFGCHHYETNFVRIDEIKHGLILTYMSYEEGSGGDDWDDEDEEEPDEEGNEDNTDDDTAMGPSDDDDEDSNDDDDNDDGCGCAVSERNPAAPLAAVMMLVGLAVMLISKKR